MAVQIQNISVEDLIGQSSKFRVYLGHIEDRPAIVKIAKTFDDNEVLIDDARMFTTLKNLHLHLKDMSNRLHEKVIDYDKLFANLERSFMEESQGDRIINVYTILDMNLDSMMPLAKLSNQFEIDVRTSVWIIGRLFKFYGMFELLEVVEHSDACKYPIFSPNDYFIGPEVHRLVYYNFSKEIQDIYATDIIRHISKYMLSWIVFTEDEKDQRYRSLLSDLVENGRETAEQAHKDLYDLVRELWGIQYYPFTYRTRETLNWKIMKEE